LLHDNDDDAAAGSGELLLNDDTTPQLPLPMAEPPEVTTQQPGPSHSPTGALSDLSLAPAPMGQSISIITTAATFSSSCCFEVINKGEATA